MGIAQCICIIFRTMIDPHVSRRRKVPTGRHRRVETIERAIIAPSLRGDRVRHLTDHPDSRMDRVKGCSSCVRSTRNVEDGGGYEASLRPKEETPFDWWE